MKNLLYKSLCIGACLWSIGASVVFAQSQQEALWTRGGAPAELSAEKILVIAQQIKVNETDEQAIQQELRSIPDTEADVLTAQWIFTVPVHVQNLHPDVKKIGIICETLFTHQAGAATYIQRVGKAKVSVDVKGGRFSGNVSVPVKAGTGPDGQVYNSKSEMEKQNILNRVDRYECKMYLINQQGDWRIPGKDYPVGHWLAADPIAPFRWSTDRKYLPR